LEGIDFEFPFRFVSEWYEAQCKFVNSLDLNEYKEEVLYSDAAQLFKVILYKNKHLVCKDAQIAVYGDRFEVQGDKHYVLPFEKLAAVTVLGRNKLNIYTEDEVLQFKGDKHFNALKYVNLYYRYKNIHQGGENGEFLGL
jgi:hypothetical protein